VCLDEADSLKGTKLMSQASTRRRFLQKIATGAGVLGCWSRLSAWGTEPDSDPLDGLDEYVEQAMVNWDVPGLVIAVIHDGKVVHSRGYGVRRAGSEGKVDSETLFNIASCTKAFTAAVVARLVDQKKVQWDDPIVEHLPAFQLFTPELTAKVTIRHALAHRTGLPNANMLWRSGAFGSEEILTRLRWLEPVAEPGERFLYNNNLFMVVGKLVEQVSGKTWKDFLQSELFEPLGMKSTTADFSGIEGLVNVASPHSSDDGKLRPVQPYCPDQIAPAGAIHSNVLDMAQWLKLHLEGGVCDGRRVLSQECVEEMHTAFPKSDSETPPEPGVPHAPITDYGLGWFVDEYEGHRVIEHGGSTTGLVTWVAIMPEQQLGFVVLANHHQTELCLEILDPRCLPEPTP
jgi:CubicO group peptidase (beta-lactamase class C family)